MKINTTVIGDCRETMKQWNDEKVKVQMCVTSPPYYGLRDYGLDGQLGIEMSPNQYFTNMVDVFRHVKNVLSDDGTLWLNIGDSYASIGGGEVEQTLRKNKDVIVNRNQIGVNGMGTSRKPPEGLKQKDLMGIPWRLALALQSDGWYLRQDIIWNKPNPMPERVQDRCTRSHEYIFLLSKKPHYYYNHIALLEPVVSGNENEKRNKRNVWSINVKSFKGAHFATFPEELITPCILAGTSEKGHCPKCGKRWIHVVEKFDIIDWVPQCDCNIEPVPDVVFDPFMGSGTTAATSLKLGRHYLGCELNPEYAPLQQQRITSITQEIS